jgi:ferredoxin
MGLEMSLRLRVNPIACTGHGMCAELLPEIISLDQWGYPILASGAVPRPLAGHARRAAELCPTLALLIDESRHRPR